MSEKQPKIVVEPTTTDRRLLVIGWSIVVLSALVLGYFYHSIPDTIATHFDHKSRADDFSHKSALWGIVVFNAISYLGLYLLATKVKPWNFNYPIRVSSENAPKVYALGIRMIVVLNLALAGLLSLLLFRMMYTAISGTQTLSWFLPVFSTVLLGIILYFGVRLTAISKT